MGAYFLNTPHLHKITYMKTLYQLLYAFQQKRGLLPLENVEDIYIFITGYAMSNDRSKSKVEDVELAHFLGFQKFMEEKTGFSPRPWSVMIRFFCSSNHETIERFFEFLDEYIKKVPLN
jgi:hypothetical protein